MAKTVGLLAGVVVAAAACTLFDKPVLLTPALPTCSTSDVACIQAHLSIEDSNQNVIPLTTIAAGTIQASQIAPELVAKAIASAIVAGWEPLSRGKTVSIVVDATGG